MPDAQLPAAKSGDEKLELCFEPEGSWDTVSDFSLPQQSPKYFIETLKYFMDEDLKLGFSHRDRGMEIGVEFCMHQHEEDWTERNTEKAAEHYMLRMEFNIFCLKAAEAVRMPLSPAPTSPPSPPTSKYHHWHKSLFNKKFTLKWISRRFINFFSLLFSLPANVWKIGCFMKMKHVMLQLWRFQFHKTHFN